MELLIIVVFVLIAWSSTKKNYSFDELYWEDSSSELESSDYDDYADYSDYSDYDDYD